MNTKSIILSVVTAACCVLSLGFGANAMTPVPPIASTYMGHPGPLDSIEIDRLSINKFVLLTDEELTHSTIMVEKAECHMRYSILIFKITTAQNDVHYYMGTYDGRFLVDCAFLGHKGDVNMLRLRPRNELVFEGDNTPEFAIDDNIVTVTRRYTTDVPMRGAICQDRCAITDVYKVDDKAMIQFKNHDESDERIQGSVATVGGDTRHTSHSDKCEYDPCALRIMDLAHLPMSDKDYLEKWDEMSEQIIGIALDEENYFPEGMTEDPDYYAEWLTRIVERDHENALLWIYDKRDSSNISSILQGGVYNEGNECLLRFVNYVLAINDPKAKIWWTKWLEECKDLINEE